MSAEPLDEIQWKSPEWIQQFGLHTGNVLDYFSESPFYDRTSNNQVLRMQFQFQQVPPNVHPQKYLQSKLTEMVGTEFVVAYVREPDFWVIRKQKRLDPHSAITEQDYYIIGANVYQSPMIYDLLSSRLLSTVLSVKKSLGLLNKMSMLSSAEASDSSAVGASAGKQAVNSASGFVSTPASVSNPGTVAQTTGVADFGSSSLAGAGGAGESGVSAAAFENLLANVFSSTDQSIYLDDIPLYGTGSTVEQLGVKLNLNDDME